MPVPPLPPTPATPTFSLVDWVVLAVYLVIVAGIGVAASRRTRTGDDFFLAGRSMPIWAVAISVLATAISAATFIGGPQQAYTGNLTYLSANIGALIAVVIVAVVFVPAFYRHRVTSIYELLGHAYGPGVNRAASAMFMIGRVFASGARLFIVAIPFALVAFGDTSPGSLVVSIAIITIVATAYTAVGGIRAVIWTDVVQAVVLVGTVTIALVMLLGKINAPIGEILTALRDDAAGDKLLMVDLSPDLRRPYTLWTAIIGFTLFNLAAFGTDQDLTQRLLTCRSARDGAWSVVISNLLSWPVVLLFLTMGLLLYVYYERPDLSGATAPAVDDTRKVFLHFILTEMPAGVRGLMMAGLFAAAMSSLDSALNAMASTTIADFCRPRWRRLRVEDAADLERRERRASRIAIVGWAVALAGFAVFCIFWQNASGQTLIDFALSVMVFAYAGLLGVFLAAILTRRGNVASAMAALLTGFVAVLLMQPFAWDRWAPALGIEIMIAFPWKMLIASGLSFAVCMLGRRSPPPSPVRATDDAAP